MARLSSGHLEAAERRIDACLRELRALLLPADDPLVALFEGRAAVIAALRGDHAQARPVFERVIPRIAEAYPESRYLTGVVAGAIRSSLAIGDENGAEAYRRQWITQLVIDGPDLQLVELFLPGERSALLERLYAAIDDHAELAIVESVAGSLTQELRPEELPISVRWYLGLHLRWAANMLANQHGWALDLIHGLHVSTRPMLDAIPLRGLVMWFASFTACLDVRGDYEAHDALVRDYLANHYRSLGPGDLFGQHGPVMTAVASFLRRDGRLAAATRVAQQAVESLTVAEGEASRAACDARAELAEIHEAAGRESDAVAERETVVALVSGWAVPLTALGETLQHFGRSGEAATAFRRALECEGGSPRARARLAEIALDEGRNRMARSHLEQALEDIPARAGPSIADVETRAILAGVLKRLGEPTRALELLDGAEGPRAK